MHEVGNDGIFVLPEFENKLHTVKGHIHFVTMCHDPFEFVLKQESPPAWTQEAYRPPRSHSNSLLFRGRGGSLDKKNFSRSEHVSSQIWCQKFFPLLGGRGVPQQKFFFPVWTCIKPNLVSKIFPFTETGYPHPKNLRPGTPPKIWDLGPPLEIWDLGPLPKNLRHGTPPRNLRPGTPPENLRHGTPPSKAGSGTPPRNVNRLKLLPSPILRMAGGNNFSW